jgi:hypothetical protein
MRDDDYRQALQALHRVPLAKFVGERTRLAAALRAAGDEDAAKQIVDRRRPTISAWTVNQLYWDQRAAFDALLAAAARIRTGDLSEARAYRQALGDLRKRAAAVLRDGAHAVTEANLRRVTGTLAALAAAGGFDPDAPGALAADREPPGFEAASQAAKAADHESRGGSATERTSVARPATSERVRLAAAARAEERKKKAEREARKAERHRLQRMLRDAQAAVRARERASSLLQQELRVSERALENARAAVHDIEHKLEVLDTAD